MAPILACLKRKSTDGVTNPWYEWDPTFDESSSSPAIRRRQLEQYLNLRRSARYLLLGEALGFQGGRFTGIAMTSERIVLDKLASRGIRANHVLGELKGQRTSRSDGKRDGYTEPTASIVWPEVIDGPIGPEDIIFWNAFPWHPYDRNGGPLTNRKPSSNELSDGMTVLKFLTAQLDFSRIIAMGKTASGLLAQAGIHCDEVRHPARGGATAFREQFSSLMRQWP